MTLNQYPKLRPVDARPTMQQGQRCLVLRDTLDLAENALIVSQQLAPLLILCDGTHAIADLRDACMREYLLDIDDETITQVLTALDEALLLDNARFSEALEAERAAFRALPYRPMSHADAVYSSDPDELRAQLDGYLAALDDVQPTSEPLRGLLSPHIDYARGGLVYAAVWQHAAQQVREADLVVLLATDHYGNAARFTLTRQSYATPYGVLPTDQRVVDALANALGEERAFAGELYHRGEHAIELVAVWLHHMRGGKPCDLVPILCGSFADITRGDGDPRGDAEIEALVTALAQATQGRRVLVIASGDMAHVGPAFGGKPLYKTDRDQLRAADDELIAQMRAGDAEGFCAAITRVSDHNNICGLPPLYTALRLLGDARGECIAYEQCAADARGTSLVSVSGVVFA